MAAVDLFQTGVYVRAPGGNVENIDVQKANGVAWQALNVGGDVGYNPAVWNTQRSKCAAAQMPYGPWMHCRSLADIEKLIKVAIEWQADLVGPNLEDVVGDHLSLEQAGSLLQQQWGNKPVHLSTLPWVQNAAGWQYVSFATLALQLFPKETPYYMEHIDACIQHAFMEGAKKVTLQYSTTSPRSVYPAAIAHCLYTADNVTNWSEWRDTVPQVPPKPPEVTVPPEIPWYEKPYIEGRAVGPAELPRPLYPPSADKGTFSGYDVMAYKRAISRAGRLKPWAPSTWSPAYGETFAMGDGSGNVGKSGVRGFQRQTWPNDKSKHTGNLGDGTYQKLRRAKISDPASPNFKQPLFDATAIALLKKAQQEYDEDAKLAAWREAVADFCKRAEGADSALWTYTQDRPYTGLGVDPEKMHRNDCSSYCCIAYFWGNEHSGLKAPDPAGYEYNGHGNTWDDLDGHPRVTSGNYLVGDLAHYDGHVTICRQAGNKDTSIWSSFGSEPRPSRRSLYYRPDFLQVVRPPLK